VKLVFGKDVRHESGTIPSPHRMYVPSTILSLSPLYFQLSLPLRASYSHTDRPCDMIPTPVQDPVDATHPSNTSTADPVLLHSLHHEKTSILSIAADARHIYSGSQAQDIYVWDRRLLKITKTLSGHTGSVLVLETCESKHWLFSASCMFSLYCLFE
jgi:WD40 repeat protein